MRCGQYLDWGDYETMPGVWIEVGSSEEAAYWAGQYGYFCGETYGIDPDEWRVGMTKKEYPMMLFFPFAREKDYGRFMRKASKEANIIKDVNQVPDI